MFSEISQTRQVQKQLLEVREVFNEQLWVRVGKR